MKVMNSESQNQIYECNQEFNLFNTGSTSNFSDYANKKKEKYITRLSVGLNSIFSIDSSSVNPIFLPKNIFSTINEPDVGGEIKFSSFINRFYDLEFFDELYESKRLIDFENNWDNEGSKSYKIKTWLKMKHFLLKFTREFFIQSSKILPTPYINPGKAGAIDLHWKTNSLELLLQIPEKNNIPISYYGDNYGKIKIRGTLDILKLNSLIEWVRLYI